jgi:hypothetical protein
MGGGSGLEPQPLGKIRAVEIQVAKSPTKNVLVVTPSYGYLALLPCPLFSERQRSVRWLMDRYTELCSRYPDANFHSMGRSNGIYLLSSALERSMSLARSAGRCFA